MAGCWIDGSLLPFTAKAPVRARSARPGPHPGYIHPPWPRRVPPRRPSRLGCRSVVPCVVVALLSPFSYGCSLPWSGDRDAHRQRSLERPPPPRSREKWGPPAAPPGARSHADRSWPEALVQPGAQVIRPLHDRDEIPQSGAYRYRLRTRSRQATGKESSTIFCSLGVTNTSAPLMQPEEPVVLRGALYRHGIAPFADQLALHHRSC